MLFVNVDIFCLFFFFVKVLGQKLRAIQRDLFV